MKKSLFQPNKRYSFSDYFNLSNPVEEIVAELGYQIQVEEIKFPILVNIDMTVINQLIKFDA